ncbi:MAG: beta-galactosidase, partial [Chloroflexota bacterium]|nr:beta-galactosidase [Chloroflexota bacterium]
MRRWFMLLLIGLLVGCGGSSTPSAPSAPTPTVAPTATPQAIATTTPTSAPTSALTPAPTNTAAATSAPTSASSPAATTAATKAPAGANGDLTQLHVGDNGEGYGFNVWGLSSDPAFRDRLYANVQGAGFGWMRQQVSWAAMEPQKGNYGTDTTAQLDQFVSGASTQGLHVLLNVVKSPDWVGAKGGLP